MGDVENKQQIIRTRAKHDVALEVTRILVQGIIETESATVKDKGEETLKAEMLTRLGKMTCDMLDALNGKLKPDMLNALSGFVLDKTGVEYEPLESYEVQIPPANYSRDKKANS